MMKAAGLDPLWRLQSFAPQPLVLQLQNVETVPEA